METIVISAVNYRSGGPLSILNDCLQYISDNLIENYHIVALVHDKKLIKCSKQIELIEFPYSVSSYILRCYYEYFYFKKLSKKLNPYLWFSLHDMTPNVIARKHALYTQNPSPFYKISKREAVLDMKFLLFNYLYTFVYRINIHKNDFVVVQQDWLRDEFKNRYGLKDIIVAHPDIQYKHFPLVEKCTNKSKEYLFLFPSFARVFKNFEIIGEAVKILSESNKLKFNVLLTIDGSENRYAKSIVQRYSRLKNIKFIGNQSRNDIFEYYRRSDCMIFPSKLDTWGLPLTEYKLFNKPILVADLPYAHETIGTYKKSVYFNHLDPKELADKMEKVMTNSLTYTSKRVQQIKAPFAKNWEELFAILLEDTK